jgi:hypothetical protein
VGAALGPPRARHHTWRGWSSSSFLPSCALLVASIWDVFSALLGFTFCSVAATSALRTGLQVNDAVLSSRGRPDSPSGHVSRGHASASASPSDLRMDDADIAAENSKVNNYQLTAHPCIHLLFCIISIVMILL